MSGGAAALSPLMIAGGSSEEALRYGVASDESHPGLLVEPGLGLFDAGILDQNLVGAHRLGRLIVACAEEAVPLGFGLCEEAGLVVEPDRRMRVIGGQGVIVVEVDPKGLSYEDDVFAVRNVGLRLVPPQDWIGAARPAESGNGAAPGTLTVERLVSGLRREVGAGVGSRGAPGGSPSGSRPRPPWRAGSTSRATAPTSKSERREETHGRVRAEAPRARLNARETDAFDLGNLTFFPGPSLYLPRTALVFDLALTGRPQPLPVAAYVEAVARVYPHLTGAAFPDHAHLFAALVSLVSRLDLGLHLRSVWRPPARAASTGSPPRRSTGAPSTARSISPGTGWRRSGRARPFDHAGRMAKLQAVFNRSPFGGPTTYALLSAAAARGIPTTYLRAEGLIQYGYGRRQVRGVSTTFSTDSQLDSGFTTRKDDCKAFLGRLGFPVPRGDVVGQPGRGGRGRRGDRLPGGGQAAGRPQGHRRHRQRPGRRRAGRGLRPRRRRAWPTSSSRPALAGSDFRLLCVNGRFVAGLERRPAWVEGDGVSTVEQLIERENATPDRADSPVSPMGKIIKRRGDDRLHRAAGLHAPEHPGRREHRPPAQGREPVGRRGQHRRDPSVHVDNIVLAQEVARHFRLTCLGIDVIAADLARSWKEGGFGIIEINAAPGVFMHVKPARAKASTSPVRSSTPGSARAAPRASRSSPSTRWGRNRSRRSSTSSCRASRTGTWVRSAPGRVHQPLRRGRCTRTT